MESQSKSNNMQGKGKAKEEEREQEKHINDHDDDDHDSGGMKEEEKSTVVLSFHKTTIFTYDLLLLQPRGWLNDALLTFAAE